MEQVLASTLAGYPVMTTDGVELGVLENVTMDLESGELQALRIDPNTEGSEPFEYNEEGKLILPADRVSARGDDYVLVDRSSSERSID